MLAIESFIKNSYVTTKAWSLISKQKFPYRFELIEKIDELPINI